MIQSMNTAYCFDFYWDCNSSYTNYVPFESFIEDCHYTFKQRIKKGQKGISIKTIKNLQNLNRIKLKNGAKEFIKGV